MDFKSKLIEKHGNPDNENFLNEYLCLVNNIKKYSNNEYTEKHHILPKTFFPEYEKENWNIINLSYNDHIKAHLLLFKSFNNRQYQRPLNWMLSSYKNTKEISNAAKKGWKKLKNNPVKYKEWKRKRIEYLKSLDSEYYSEKAKIFWNNITEEEYNDFCVKMKNIWTAEKRKKQSISLKKFYENPINVDKKRIETQKRWDSMSLKERKDFSNKMKVVNNDIFKLKKSSKSMKIKWKDQSFLEKMKNRNSKPKTKYKVIKPNGESFEFEGFQELIENHNFNAYLVRKFKNTNQSVVSKSRKEDALNTIGYKFYTI